MFESLEGKKGEWYVVIQFLLFALVIFGPRYTATLPFWSNQLRTLSKPLGFILLGLGSCLIIAGLIHLGKNLSALPHPKKNAELVQTGAYALVRHPIYSGIIFASFGWSVLAASSLMLFYGILLFLFFELKSKREETQLTLFFKDYASYQKRVKKLIPFIY